MTEEYQNFAPCCACETKEGDIKNIVMLNQKLPGGGKGWGCLQCGLPLEGAIAALCNPCIDLGRPIKFAVVSLDSEERIPVEQLGGVHEHDMTKHQHDEEANRLTEAEREVRLTGGFRTVK
jgi:hypothetical protein